MCLQVDPHSGKGGWPSALGVLEHRRPAQGQELSQPVSPAERFHSQVKAAALAGQSFDVKSGLPLSMSPQDRKDRQGVAGKQTAGMVEASFEEIRDLLDECSDGEALPAGGFENALIRLAEGVVRPGPPRRRRLRPGTVPAGPLRWAWMKMRRPNRSSTTFSARLRRACDAGVRHHQTLAPDPSRRVRPASCEARRAMCYRASPCRVSPAGRGFPRS